jgi:type II secretion system protein C
MMNKIRNLFKKFQKKKSDADSDGHDVHNDFEDIFDEADQGVVEEIVDEKTGDLPVVVMEREDLTSEIIIDSDQTENVTDEEFTDQHTLDLANGKVPLKDRLVDVFENLKTTVSNFKITKPKKLNLNKNVDADSTKKINLTGPIKLPPKLQALENSLRLHFQRINWRKLHNDFFDKSRWQFYHRTFQVTVVVLCVYMTGKIIGLSLKGTNDYKDLKRNVSFSVDRSQELTTMKISQLKNAKLFKTEVLTEDGKTDKPKVQMDILCKKADKKSNLPIKLVNTVVLQDSVKSIAAVQIRSENLLKEFREGESISSMAKIDKIERLRVIVKNLQDGSCESIENEKQNNVRSNIAVMSPKQSADFKKLQQKLPGIDSDGNNFTIDKSLINEKMANISDILTQARGIQITNPDGTLSFKIVEIQPGGIFSYLGIENNDIITQINGQPINDLNAVMGLFGKITTIDKLNLTIKRGGAEMPLDYKFR